MEQWLVMAEEVEGEGTDEQENLPMTAGQLMRELWRPVVNVESVLPRDLLGCSETSLVVVEVKEDFPEEGTKLLNSMTECQV